MSPESNQRVTEVVKALVRAANIEILPIKGMFEKLPAVPKETTVTLTCSPKLGIDRTVEYATQATEAGYLVVPHFAARQVKDEAHLRELVGRIESAGIRRLYVIGGDMADPVGEFSSAAELLETLSGIEHKLERVGVACYAEGHPAISDQALLDALRRKQPYANYMVNQLCFDANVLVPWIRKVRGLGITLPLNVGIAAPMNIRKLMELSVKIGVGSSIKYLTKQHGLVGNLLRGSAYQPEQLLYEIGDDLSSAELGIEGLHVFSFNQIAETVEWQRKVVG